MEGNHVQLIRCNYTKLKASMRENIEAVCEFLYEKNIITITMKERVLCTDTPSRQSTNLLDLIVHRGRRAFGALYEACKQSGLCAAADILRPDKAPHQKLSSTGCVVEYKQKEKPLPDRWPTLEHYDRVKSGKLFVKAVTMEENPEMIKKYRQHLYEDSRSIYKMHHRIRGTALIILNKNFVNGRTPGVRHGSDMDLMGLEQLFTRLGFNVIAEKDQTEKEINAAIDGQVDACHENDDCFVFFIMSYGHQGTVQDIHGRPMAIQSMIDRLSEMNDMRDKPKLLFFQACQGDDEGAGHFRAIEAQPEEDEALGSFRHDGAMPSTEIASINVYKNVFLFRSSPDGNLSYRHTTMGSWFTQAIIYVFSEHAHDMELDELQNEVNRLVSKAATRRDKYKNISEFISVPGKQFYFFPGLYDHSS